MTYWNIEQLIKDVHRCGNTTPPYVLALWCWDKSDARVQKPFRLLCHILLKRTGSGRPDSSSRISVIKTPEIYVPTCHSLQKAFCFFRSRLLVPGTSLPICSKCASQMRRIPYLWHEIHYMYTYHSENNKKCVIKKYVHTQHKLFAIKRNLAFHYIQLPSYPANIESNCCCVGYEYTFECLPISCCWALSATSSYPGFLSQICLASFGRKVGSKAREDFTCEAVPPWHLVQRYLAMP